MVTIQLCRSWFYEFHRKHQQDDPESLYENVNLYHFIKQFKNISLQPKNRLK